MLRHDTKNNKYHPDAFCFLHGRQTRMGNDYGETGNAGYVWQMEYWNDWCNGLRHLYDPGIRTHAFPEDFYLGQLPAGCRYFTDHSIPG